MLITKHIKVQKWKTYNTFITFILRCLETGNTFLDTMPLESNKNVSHLGRRRWTKNK